MTDSHYNKLWELHHTHGSVTSSHQLHHLLYNFIVLLSTLVARARHVFPKDWFLMHTVTNSIVLTAMEEIAKPISQYFSQGNAFDYQVRRLLQSMGNLTDVSEPKVLPSKQNDQ